MLMVPLFLCAKTSNAYPFQAVIEPKCSECGGRGTIENFWGERIRCKNCSGDGRTFRWWLAIVLGVMWYTVFCRKDKK